MGVYPSLDQGSQVGGVFGVEVFELLEEKARSVVEPVAEVMAVFTSAAMMVVRPSSLAFASDALTTAVEKVLIWSRKQDTASTPTRKVELALKKASTVLGFVIPGFGIVRQYSGIR